MTKAQRILALYETGKYTTRQIADVVDCEPAYVRVVARQRKGSGSSDIDRRYRQSENGREVSAARKRRWCEANPEEHNRRCREYLRRRYHADPEYRAKRLAREAEYRAKRRAEARAS